MINAKEYWDKRYASGGNSGYGSYDEQLTKKLEWLSGLPIQSIAEIGCGDFNFGKNLLEYYPEATYVGQDISSVIIAQNKKQYSHPQRTFQTTIPVPGADLILCIDVLYHVLDDNDYATLLLNLKQALHESKYLALTAYENEQETAPHLKIRKFDYKDFGEPTIREIVEVDGQLYFYLFKREAIELAKTTCILITKDSEYPQEVFNNIRQYPFGQVLIGVNCDSPYRKYSLMEQAKFDTIYYQDDDAIVPIDTLLQQSKPGIINVGMKAGHAESYRDNRATMGLGWGSIFPKSILNSLKQYTDKYGKDEIFQRETERILTYLNYPQNRIILNIIDLPSAMAPDRLWRQPEHHEFRNIAEQRCVALITHPLITL